MTPERWRQIESLFLQAVERPDSERQRFIDEACRGDDDLQRELVSMLACDDPASLIKLTSIAGEHILDRDGDDGATAEMAGRRIGAYRVVRLLGHGGMGSVYLAVRDDHYEKEVAIKLLKRGMDTDSLLSRFRQERQILANLEHPFIARLLDGGATEAGLPYFVMEYVDGLPITKYCNHHNLDLGQRLRLFRLVCEAVQYAHQNLVVHRDLKPGNILITKERIPKLLDFGIAKLIRPELPPDVATITRSGQRLMTPDYASPEQVMGLPVNTSSDIYSLGAVLYELLTGQRAHRFTSDSLAEMERVIRDLEPEKPSLVVNRASPDTPRLQKLRRRQLSGDLDNVVLAALRKEPQRRYSSAAEFSEDIRRHMDGMPVMAREDRIGYRWGKFVRRNKLAVVAAAMVIVGLIGGIVATTLQARRAERRFQLVREMATTLVVDLNGQMERLPGSTAVRASMIHTVVRYLDGLGRDEGGDPALDLEIADAYCRVAGVEGHPFRQNLGQTGSALAHYRRALEMYERLSHLPKTRARALEAMIGCLIEAGDVEARTGNSQEAAARLEKAAAIEREFSGGNGMELSPGTRVYVYFRLGDAQTRRGATQAALTHYRKALELSRSAAATDWSLEARSTLRAAHSRLAGAQLESGDLYSARENLEIALRAAQESVRQPDTIVNERSALLGAYHLLGDVLGNPHDLNLGDRSGALSNYRKAMEIGEELVAADRQDVRARGDTAGLYRHMGALLLEENPTEALNFYRRAFALSEELSDANPSNMEFRRDVGLALLGTGESLHKLGKKEEALVNLTRALERTQASIAGAPDQLAWIRTVSRAQADIGSVLLERGDVDGALESHRLGLASAEKLVERAPSNLYFQRDRADAMEGLGRHYRALAARPGVPAGRRSELTAEALSWFQKSLAIWRDWTKRDVATPYAAWRQSRVAAVIASLDPK